MTRWLVRLASLLTLLLTACSGTRPDHLGMREGRLAPCPSSPNCVSSFSDDPAHFIEPLRYRSSPERAMARLEALLRAHPRTRLIVVQPDYIYAEFTTRIMRFVDDVELLLDAEAGVIHCRSASRIGHFDFGTNSRRIELIRELFLDETNKYGVP